MLLGGIALVLGLCYPSGQATSKHQPVESAPEGVDWKVAAPGPWGSLEYRRIVLPVPEMWCRKSRASGLTVWKVPNFNPERLDEMIAGSPLTDVEKLSWRESCRREPSEGGVSIYPSTEFRWLLSPRSRALLYVWLSRFPENESLVFPFSYPAASFEEWFDSSSLRPEMTAAIKHLLYPAGGAMCFADLDLVEEYLSEEPERVELLTLLHRQPYYELSLHMNGRSDIAALARYWGYQIPVNPRAETLLPKDRRLPLESLLPPLPRSLLNAYPTVRNGEAWPKGDCFWTALNFFNEQADSRFSNAGDIEEALQNQYHRIPDAPAFGDLILLENRSGRPIHAAVYLAADFVYTKNGGHATKPWVVMKLTDMEAAYALEAPLRPTFYRRTGDGPTYLTIAGHRGPIN